jgi:hypothetical protein
MSAHEWLAVLALLALALWLIRPEGRRGRERQARIEHLIEEHLRRQGED